MVVAVDPSVLDDIARQLRDSAQRISKASARLRSLIDFAEVPQYSDVMTSVVGVGMHLAVLLHGEALDAQRRAEQIKAALADNRQLGLLTELVLGPAASAHSTRIDAVDREHPWRAQLDELIQHAERLSIATSTTRPGPGTDRPWTDVFARARLPLARSGDISRVLAPAGHPSRSRQG